MSSNGVTRPQWVKAYWYYAISNRFEFHLILLSCRLTGCGINSILQGTKAAGVSRVIASRISMPLKHQNFHYWLLLNSDYANWWIVMRRKILRRWAWKDLASFHSAHFTNPYLVPVPNQTGRSSPPVVTIARMFPHLPWGDGCVRYCSLYMDISQTSKSKI